MLLETERLLEVTSGELDIVNDRQPAGMQHALLLDHEEILSWEEQKWLAEYNTIIVHRGVLLDKREALEHALAMAAAPICMIIPIEPSLQDEWRRKFGRVALRRLQAWQQQEDMRLSTIHPSPN